MKSARIAPDPKPPEALAWLQEDPGGAIAFVVTCAKGAGVRLDPRPQAPVLLDAALEAALAAGVRRALAWHGTGDVATGAPVVIVGASAEHRKDALRAVDLLLAGLKGIAARTDLPATPSNLSQP